MAQKMAKSLPKRATSTHAKSYREASWKQGRDRKTIRNADADARAAANRAAGKTPKRQTRKPRADNLMICRRCTKRVIVCGQVCWCQQIGDAR